MERVHLHRRSSLEAGEDDLHVVRGRGQDDVNMSSLYGGRERLITVLADDVAEGCGNVQLLVRIQHDRVLAECSACGCFQAGIGADESAVTPGSAPVAVEPCAVSGCGPVDGKGFGHALTFEVMARGRNVEPPSQDDSAI